MEIRLARPAEHAAIGELTVAAYAALPGMGPMGRYGEELADVDGRAGGPGRVLVACEGDELVGAVTYYDRYADELPSMAERLGPVAGFRMLATAPAAQGRGVGAALTTHCVELARTAGAPSIALHTTDLMQAAQRLYVRLGFARWPDIDLRIGSSRPITVMGFRLVC
jgi:ribosomal protein S18 acetylase RimI-like enzyme